MRPLAYSQESHSLRTVARRRWSKGADGSEGPGSDVALLLEPGTGSRNGPLASGYAFGCPKVNL